MVPLYIETQSRCRARLCVCDTEPNARIKANRGSFVHRDTARMSRDCDTEPNAWVEGKSWFICR